VCLVTKNTAAKRGRKSRTKKKTRGGGIYKSFRAKNNVPGVGGGGTKGPGGTQLHEGPGDREHPEVIQRGQEAQKKKFEKKEVKQTGRSTWGLTTFRKTIRQREMGGTAKQEKISLHAETMGWIQKAYLTF